jgi:PGF-CTERM protein
VAFVARRREASGITDSTGAIEEIRQLYTTGLRLSIRYARHDIEYMTQKFQSAGMALVVLLAAVVGGVALTGTATALEGHAGATYPATPGTDTLGTFVFAAEPGDNVAKNGIKTITLDFSSGAGVANVSDKDVFISVRGSQRIEIAEEPSDITEVNSLNVSSNAAKNTVAITLPQPVRPRIPSGGVGAEIAIKVENVTTPSQPGTYTVEGTFAGPSGNTDGPATVSYSVSSPALSMTNQSLSQFSSQQTINVSASIPGGGYVGLFTTAANGSRGQLVGWTNVSAAPSVGNYTIDVGNNITETQRLVAVAYTESKGRSAGLRAEQSFDPVADEPLVVNGRVVNATATVSTLDVDARVTAGTAYDQGTRLYFMGDPNTAYRIFTVQNGELGSSAAQFQTAANGTEIIDTAQLGKGRYAISRVDTGSLVSLDNDSTTGPADDSFLVTGQQATTTRTAAASNATAAGTAATTGTTATAAGGTATSGSNGTGGGQQGTGAGGPGFGVVVTVVALLGAALLMRRR